MPAKHTLEMLQGLAYEASLKTGRAYRIEENAKGLVRVLEDGKDLFCLGYLTNSTLHRMLYALLIGLNRCKET